MCISEWPQRTPFFFQTCIATHQRCPLSDYANVASLGTLIAEYILGTYICCATPWAFCDHVVMPFFVKEEAHFIIAHFDIEERCLIIYDSLIAMAHQSYAISDMQPLYLLIPMCLENTGFYDARKHIWTSVKVHIQYYVLLLWLW